MKEADVTITRLAEDRFYFVTGSALGVRDRATIERHIPAAGGVTIDDLTSAKAVLNLCGPRSREVLGALTDAPLDNTSFPYMSAREIDVALAKTLEDVIQTQLDDIGGNFGGDFVETHDFVQAVEEFGLEEAFHGPIDDCGVSTFE